MEYKTNLLDLRCCDNMELMSQFEDNYFDLAVVDPPYGIDCLKKINPNTKANWKEYKYTDWDKSIPNEDYFKGLFRISKNQIIWGGNYMLENLYSSPCFLIWDKIQEFKGSHFEIAWTSFKTPAKAFRMSRVQAYTTGIKIHPTQKPIKLYDWIFQNYAKEGDKILDTHLGSGSIAIASHYAGLHLTACEIDEDYFKDSIERIKIETSQETLF